MTKNKKKNRVSSKFKSILEAVDKIPIETKKHNKNDKIIMKYQKYLTKLKAPKSKRKRSKYSRNTLLAANSNERHTISSKIDCRNKGFNFCPKQKTKEASVAILSSNKSMSKQRGHTSRRHSKVPASNKKLKEMKPGILYKNSVVINNPESICQLHLSSIDQAYKFN